MRKLVNTLWIVWAIFILTGMLPIFFIVTPNNAGLLHAIKLTFIPVGILIAITCTIASIQTHTGGKAGLWWFAFLTVYPLATFFSYGHYLTYNALTSQGQNFTLTGIVLKKYTGSKPRSHTISIRDSRSGDVIGIDISEELYLTTSPGDVYTFCYKNGGLGIPFFWGISGPPNC